MTTWKKGQSPKAKRAIIGRMFNVDPLEGEWPTRPERTIDGRVEFAAKMRQIKIKANKLLAKILAS